MSAPIFRIWIFRTALVLSFLAGARGSMAQGTPAPEDEPSLLRVNILNEFRGPKGMVELDGKILTDYSPIIIQDFTSAGIVLDDKGHVMTFLGYRWVDLRSDKPRIELSTRDGKKYPARLIGIDERSGVAVVQATSGKLRATRVCESCAGEDGALVMVPDEREAGPRFGQAKVSTVHAVDAPIPGAFQVPMPRPITDISLPVLNRDLKVIGFMTGMDYPNPIEAGVVYPVGQLLDSARQILAAGKDIKAGWLGIRLQDAPAGVMVQRVEPGSPAQEAGLIPHDFLLRYNSLPVENARQFIGLIENSAIGARVTIGIRREGNPMNLTARIRERQDRPVGSRLSLNSPRPLVGLDTVVMTPDLADAMQMPGQTGLLITGVQPQSPADAAGVLAGDVIIAMDGQPISDVASFASYWQTHGLGQRLVLQVLRKGKKRNITVNLPR